MDPSLTHEHGAGSRMGPGGVPGRTSPIPAVDPRETASLRELREENIRLTEQVRGLKRQLKSSRLVVFDLALRRNR